MAEPGDRASAIRRAGDAARQSDWAAALAAFRELDAAGTATAEDADRHGTFALFDAQIEEASRAWGRLVETLEREGRQPDAAPHAVRLWWLHAERMDRPRSIGWLRRAERLLGDSRACAGHAHLAVAEATLEQARDRNRAAYAKTTRAVELATQFDVPEIAALATARLAHIHAHMGDDHPAAEALAQGDELLSRVTIPTPLGGITRGVMIGAALRLDLERGRELHETFDAWAGQYGLAGFQGMFRARWLRARLDEGDYSALEELAATQALLDRWQFLRDRGALLVAEARARSATGDREAAGRAMRRAQELGTQLTLGERMMETLPTMAAVGQAPTLAAEEPDASPPRRDPLLEHTIDDRIQVIRVLARGGMGTVLEGRHRVTGRRLAVKVLNADLRSDERVAQRMLNEAMACGRIRHPNVIDVYDAGLFKRVPYLVMELLEGETLAKRIKREGRLALEDAADVVMQAAAGLEAAHRADVLHRDLKPSNVFLTSELSERGYPQVKVLDFGVSKVANMGPSTKSGAILGTPQYMAPEQIEAAKDLDLRADVYSLGALLYEALTGELPFSAPSYPGLVTKILEGPFPDPRTLRPEVGPALAEVIRRATMRSKEDRFDGAGALGRALRAALTSDREG